MFASYFIILPFLEFRINIDGEIIIVVSDKMTSCNLLTPPPQLYSKGFRNGYEFMWLPLPQTVYRGL